MLKKDIIIAICLIAISFGGCMSQRLDPKAELLFSQKTFLRIVNSLTILREAGKFDDAEIERIKFLVNSGDNILDQWTLAVLEGRESPDIIDAFDIVLRELIKYKERGESNE